MFLKNRKIISKIKRSNVTDYAALNMKLFVASLKIRIFKLQDFGNFKLSLMIREQSDLHPHCMQYGLSKNICR